MSRNFAVLGKSAAATPPSLPDVEASPGPSPRASEYVGLIGRLFHGRSVVAVVGCGFDGVASICDGIAAELSASGKRVVVVAAARLLAVGPDGLPGMGGLPETDPDAEAAFVPGTAANVSYWPAPPARQLRFFKKPAPARQSPPYPDKWLDLLRQNFDSVLCSCPALELDRQKPEPQTDVLDIAAAADTAVLVVEAGRTTGRRILYDQRALQSRGVRLAGCILVHRR